LGLAAHVAGCCSFLARWRHHHKHRHDKPINPSKIRRCSRLLADEQGSVAVMVALSMVVVVAFVGLAVDVGQLRLEKGRLQAAADAVALSGALESSQCAGTAGCAAMVTAAQTALCENGYKLNATSVPTGCTRSTSGVTLALNNGPSALGASDPNHGSTSYVEVVLTETQPLYFANVIGLKSMNLNARAETATGSSNSCMYVLRPTGTALQLNASTLTMQCGITIESNSSSAMQVNASTVTADPINIHGGYSSSSSTINGNISTGVATTSDPLAYIPTPPLGSCGSSSASPFYGAATAAVVNTGNATFNPGRYCQGITINAGTATFKPGIYILDSWMQVNAGSISGTGVTFYITTGSIQFNATANITLVAPTTGTYAGILFYQSPTNGSAAQLNAAIGSKFEGALYFPDATLQLNASNTAAYTIVDAAQVQLNASKFTLNDDYSSLPGGSPIKGGTSVLVE
jgi:Flp pilus assembly protein TadG